MATLVEVLADAKQAAFLKARSVWENDGKIDCGSCGSAIMLLKGNTKVAKAAILYGMAYARAGDVYVKHFIPDEVRSQNAAIYQDSMQAFRDVLIANGHEKAIKKFWTYID